MFRIYAEPVSTALPDDSAIRKRAGKSHVTGALGTLRIVSVWMTQGDSSVSAVGYLANPYPTIASRVLADRGVDPITGSFSLLDGHRCAHCAPKSANAVPECQGMVSGNAVEPDSRQDGCAGGVSAAPEVLRVESVSAGRTETDPAVPVCLHG